MQFELTLNFKYDGLSAGALGINDQSGLPGSGPYLQARIHGFMGGSGPLPFKYSNQAWQAEAKSAGFESTIVLSNCRSLILT